MHPVTKLRAHEAVLEAMAKGECQAIDLAVMVYITSNMDNRAGDCVRKVDTMANALGTSRATVFRALGRLEDAGLIERRQNHGVDGRQLATHYLIGPAVQAFARAAAAPAVRRRTCETPPSHGCDTSNESSRVHNYPAVEQGKNRISGRKGAADSSEPVDWYAWQEWLADQVNYPKHWSDGSRADARGDLAQIRESLGDAETVRALETARANGWFGAKLRTILLEWTHRGRAA